MAVNPSRSNLSRIMLTAHRTSNPHLQGGSATRKTRATGDDNDDGNWYFYLLVFVYCVHALCQ